MGFSDQEKRLIEETYTRAHRQARSRYGSPCGHPCECFTCKQKYLREVTEDFEGEIHFLEALRAEAARGDALSQGHATESPFSSEARETEKYPEAEHVEVQGHACRYPLCTCEEKCEQGQAIPWGEGPRPPANLEYTPPRVS